ncbi:MAG: histidine kinase N-terminal 7TM domain-containing protein [Candidatus Geothermincolia bacterium]
MHLNSYAITLFASAALSAAISVYAWRRRSVEAGLELTLLMLAAASWSLMQGIEAVATTRFAKIALSVAAYPGTQAVPVLLLLLSLRFTKRGNRLSKRSLVILSAIPCLTFLIAATNGLHGWLWPSVTLTESYWGITAKYAHGIWFWVSLSYSYGVVLAAIGILLVAGIRLQPPRSRQAGLLLLAVLAPLAANIVYAAAPGSVDWVDITPIAFAATGTLITLALFRYRLLDLRPIAKNVMFDSIGDLLIAVDAGGRVVDMNPAAKRLLNGRKLAGVPAAEVFAALPDVAEAFLSDAESGSEFRPLNGTAGDYDLRSWPLRDSKERLLGWLISLHDVSDLHHVEKELKRINEELDGYAHTVSHDLKGPLAAIGLAIDSVEMLSESPERFSQTLPMLLGSMRKSLDKAVSLINGLLGLAEAGQRALRIERVDLNELVERVLEEHQGAIETKGVRVEAMDLGSVLADPTLMYQLFANIIGNAIRHNTSPAPLVSIERSRRGGWHVFKVKDNGDGIDDKDIGHIFQPFYGGENGGNGIGLATSQRIVAVYGGEIHAYNDDGACFEFTLPDRDSAPAMSARSA